MLITLPWPDMRLTPNAKRRKHWRSYQPAIKAARETGWWQTLHALHGATPEFIGHIPMTVSFYPPDNRRRDLDGMIGSLKHSLDGIADALKVDDNRFRPTFQILTPEKPGRVEVVIGA